MNWNYNWKNLVPIYYSYDAMDPQSFDGERQIVTFEPDWAPIWNWP